MSNAFSARTFSGDTIVIDLRQMTEEEKNVHDMAARKLPKVGKSIRKKMDRPTRRKTKDNN